MHRLLVLTMMFTEQTVVAENGESNGSRVLVDDRTRTASSVAFGVGVMNVSDVQTLLWRFGRLVC